MGLGRRVLHNSAHAARQMFPLRIADGSWLTWTLQGDLPEQTQTGFGPPTLGLFDLLRTLDRVSSDPRFEGVLIYARGAAPSLARTLTLHRAIGQLREAGKKVVVWAESLTGAAYVAFSAADRLWLPESANLPLVGIATERFFFRDLLDKVGARPEVVHIGRFKSAGEMFTRDSMSPEEREQVELWQSDVFGTWVDAIAVGRKLEPSAVKDRIDAGPYSARAALESGLIDGLLYEDEVAREIERWVIESGSSRSGGRQFKTCDAFRYWARQVNPSGFEPLLREAPRITYWVATGAIRRGEGRRGIAHQTVPNLLETLRESDAVRGVVLRLDSPGGDALASDLIHRGIERLVREKPVVVSMGDVVASGGYYMAAAADAIFAEPTSLTGSIGVVGGKLNLSGLYERLGVAKEIVEKGARASLYSEAKAFSSDERGAVRREMEGIYQIFLDRVARGRPLTLEELEEIAQGRIWSGQRAKELGLVDQLGGPLEAFRDVSVRAGLLKEESVCLEMLPRTSSWSLLLSSGLGRLGLSRVGL